MYAAADYGVVGDGEADDTAAINTAIATVSAASSATKRGRLVFDDGVYLTDGMVIKPNVWLDFGNAYFKKRSNGATPQTNSLLRAVPAKVGGSYYGTYKNIKITGGTFDSNGFTCPAHIVNLIYCEDLDVSGMTAIHSAANATWAFCFGGRRLRIDGLKVLGGSLLFQDGVHVCHGQHINVSNIYAESGDDVLALGSEPTDVYFSVDPDPLRYVNVSNVGAKSNRGNAIKIYAQQGAIGPNWEVTDISITGVTGTSGMARNGGIAITDKNGGKSGFTQIKRISITNTKLKVGADGHDGVNAYGLWVMSATDLSLEASMDLHQSISSGLLTDSDITCLKFTTPGKARPTRVRCTGAQ